MSQTYFPYRSDPRIKSEILRLSNAKLSKILLDIFKSWFLVFLFIYISYRFDNFLLSTICIIIIGTQFYSLLIIAHDGLHRTLAKNPNLNDFLNDFLILGAFFAATRVNRKNHLEHHSKLANIDDPDRYKYATSSRNTVLNICSGCLRL